jgi:flagellar hook assembly protein FlgD
VPDARLTLFSVQGRRVRELHAGPLGEGRRSIAWDGRDDAGAPVPSGVYFAVLSDGTRLDVKKLVVSR